MSTKDISLRLVSTSLLALVLLGLTNNVQASSIEGTALVIGSSLNDDPLSYQTVTVGSGVEIDSSDPSKRFSWMIADSDDSIDFFSDSEDSSKNRFLVTIDSDHIFSETDKLNFSVQLASGWTFGATALTQAINVTGAGDVEGDLLTFTLQGLDQIDADSGNGRAGFVFYANAPEPVPLPGALWMFGFALVGMVGAAARKRATVTGA